MKTNGVTMFSDGTVCDYCSNLIFTKLELQIKKDGKDFCCKECVDEYDKSKTIST